MTPMPSRRNQCDALSCALTRKRKGERINAPSASRNSTSANAPKSLAAMRMNRNDPPQIAPSSSSSAGVSQEDDNAEAAVEDRTEVSEVDMGNQSCCGGRAAGSCLHK